MSLGARVRGRIARAVGDEPERGSAVVEFLFLTLVLLVPLLYLVLVLGRLEAAEFATESAAREAARTVVAADDDAHGLAAADAIAALALEDQGFEPAGDELVVRCESAPCVSPGAAVEATVQLRVPLPFVPAFARDVVPLEVPVTATRTAVVDEYRVVGAAP